MTGALRLAREFAREKRPSGNALVWGLAVGLIGSAVLAATVGAVPLSLANLADPIASAVLFDIRLPRIALGALVGAGLALSGAALQGLFRNPLVDPGLIGSTSGGAFGAACAIVLGGEWLHSKGFALALPVAAFLGSLLATSLVYRGASSNGRTQVTQLILLGVGVNAMAGVGIGLLTFIADDSALRNLAFWNMGSVGGADWPTILAVCICTLPALVYLVRLGRSLDAMALGEREAALLGLDVESIKRRIVVLSSLCVGAGVSAAGAIGFVGLVVPHLIRLVAGPAHTRLLPAVALGGATLVVLADVGARTLVSPVELPIGIVTSALGAPVFVMLVRSRGSSGGLG